jgi:MoaA/NifB/PqqE/SkfB family radical SAM enzyme
MVVDDYARVARESMALGAVNFSFQGGEPLLFQELGRTIEACHPALNVISVTTNGTLLSEDKVSELKSLGVDILTVSLDSSIAEEHDRFRGAAGSFDKTMAGIKLALSRGLRVTLGTVVTHQSLRSEGIAGLLRLAVELRVILYLILPVPAGRWMQNREMLLTSDDLEYIDDLTRSTPYVRTDFQANFGPHGCGAVKEILYLTPYGDVLACPFIHISLGNIFEESVSAIRARALQNPFFAEYHPRCLASTDAEFIDECLSKTFEAKERPIPWHDAFPESNDDVP